MKGILKDYSKLQKSREEGIWGRGVSLPG